MVAVPVSSAADPERLNWGGSIVAAALATLGRPATWPVALAAFLVRGGIVALVLPVIVLPSPTGIANAFAPMMTSAFLGRVTLELLVPIAALSGAVTAIIILGGMIAAWLDATLVRDAASDDELGGLRRPVPDLRGVAWRGLAVRLASYAPLALVLAWGTGRITGAVYGELILPDDLSSPLALRVLARVPEAVAAIALAWILGEVVGGLALRHLVLDGPSMLGALRAAIGDLTGRPLPSLATTIVTDAVLAVGFGFSVLASAVAAERVRLIVTARGSDIEIALSLLLFAGVWFASFLAVGALTAFRSVAWTFELARRGTIGVSDQHPPGDWATPDVSGRL